MSSQYKALLTLIAELQKGVELAAKVSSVITAFYHAFIFYPITRLNLKPEWKFVLATSCTFSMVYQNRNPAVQSLWWVSDHGLTCVHASRLASFTCALQHADDCAARGYFASKSRRMHNHFSQLNDDLIDIAAMLDTSGKGRRRTEEKIQRLVGN